METTSIVKVLENRQLGNTRSYFRTDRNLLKKILSLPTAKFKKVWEVKSKKRISYENERIFLNNFSTVYSLYGIRLKPTRLYSKKNMPKRIYDSMVVEYPLDHLPDQVNACRPSLLSVSNKWLLRHDITSGKTLQFVYLSDSVKYQHITANNFGHSIVLKSVFGSGGSPYYVRLVLMKLYPLEFTCCFDVTENIFGKGVVDVMVGEGLLFTMHNNNVVKGYSFEMILEQCLLYKASLGKACHDFDGQIVGSMPCGLPVNLKITQTPPVLFQLNCLNRAFDFGGNPWHYIYANSIRDNQFNICSLKNKRAVEKCHQLRYYDGIDVEENTCIFHPDDSGRVIHKSLYCVTVYKIIEMNGGYRKELVKDFYISKDFPTIMQHNYTSSGRQIKTPEHREEWCQRGVDTGETIQTFYYDDDMDLLTILSHPIMDLDHCVTASLSLSLHDNQTGQQLNYFDLKGFCSEDDHQSVTLDGDVIVCIEYRSSSTVCRIYRLDISRD